MNFATISMAMLIKIRSIGEADLKNKRNLFIP